MINEKIAGFLAPPAADTATFQQWDVSALPEIAQFLFWFHRTMYPTPEDAAAALLQRLADANFQLVASNAPAAADIERDREMATECVRRMHPSDTTLNLEPQIDHVAIYLGRARAEGRRGSDGEPTKKE